MGSASSHIPGEGGREEAGEPCREPPVDGTQASQPASQRDREMEEEEEEEQRRAAQWLHGVARPKTPPPPKPRLVGWLARSLAPVDTSFELNRNREMPLSAAAAAAAAAAAPPPPMAVVVPLLLLLLLH